MGRRKVLAFMAHPDDAEVLCAGTLIRLAAAGWEVHIATLTPGDCGTTTEDRWAISTRRTGEARSAIDTAGFRFASLTAIDDPDFLPGGAKYDDLPGMIALSAPYPLWLAGENDSALSLISAAYRATGQEDKLTVSQTKDAEPSPRAVKWLLKITP
jgi:LmbE family N-acetylglucosaminyl deacetylase